MPHTLLLVDDDVTFTTVIKSSLEKEGYQVYSAHHAKEAMRYLDKHHREIEVMLLDWSMPDVSGIELLRQVKQDKTYENIPVIIQTVLGNPEYIQQGLEAGAFFYLVKPVNKTLLISTIRAAIVDLKRRRDLLSKLRESERALRFMVEGVFHFQTVQQGDNLAVRIANECPNPQEAVYISELFANAVEHGNVNLSYEEKSELISKNGLQAEVRRRLSLPEYRNKYVKVTFKKKPDLISILVEDMGNGFNFSKYLQFDDGRVFDNHGRGIAILNALFSIKYLGKGNKVLVEIPLKVSYRQN
ncbi:MAG: response regulator [Chitinophagales bacterium]|nr:response regulator [Chitinophagales bacterium]